MHLGHAWKRSNRRQHNQWFIWQFEEKRVERPTFESCPTAITREVAWVSDKVGPRTGISWCHLTSTLCPHWCKENDSNDGDYDLRPDGKAQRTPVRYTNSLLHALLWAGGFWSGLTSPPLCSSWPYLKVTWHKTFAYCSPASCQASYIRASSFGARLRPGLYTQEPLKPCADCL